MLTFKLVFKCLLHISQGFKCCVGWKEEGNGKRRHCGVRIREVGADQSSLRYKRPEPHQICSHHKRSRQSAKFNPILIFNFYDRDDSHR